jgi:hypothetical protein
MCRMSSTDKPDLFAHPDPRDFDYKPLLIALRECRQRVTEFMSATGVRNPAYIDAVARLTRIEGAGRFVAREVDEIRF